MNARQKRRQTRKDFALLYGQDFVELAEELSEELLLQICNEVPICKYALDAYNDSSSIQHYKNKDLLIMAVKRAYAGDLYNNQEKIHNIILDNIRIPSKIESK